MLISGFSIHSFSQKILFEAKIKKEQVPAEIIKSVTEDFPGFSITDISAIPVELVGEDVIVDRDATTNKNYNTYEISLIGKGKELDAYYDKSGKLISSDEHMKDFPLPAEISKSVEKSFPGWAIEKDFFKMTHYVGSKTREHYKLVIKKGKEKKRVFMDAGGNLIKVS